MGRAGPALLEGPSARPLPATLSLSTVWLPATGENGGGHNGHRDKRTCASGNRVAIAKGSGAYAPPEPKRLLVMPGGHHRSLQHDVELQNESLRFVERALVSG